MHRNTCATLVRAGVNVVGIVCCTRRRLTDRLKQASSRLRRHGLRTTLSQVSARVVYELFAGPSDRRSLQRLVNDADNREVLAALRCTRIETSSYSDPQTRSAIDSLQPDILIVHSPYIVGRSVRALARVCVIGGHPGITPFYRGSHSAFWALLRGEPGRVGWTVFVLDDGIDTGPIVAQDCLDTTSGQSHMVLSWQGMIEEAKSQAAVIRTLDLGTKVPLVSHHDIPSDSYFGAPTFGATVRYLLSRRAEGRFVQERQL